MRRAVTLVELLISMAIMAILAAAILGVGSAAMESARRSRTQSTITKIHSLLLERIADYEVRRLAVDTSGLMDDKGQPDGQQIAQVRLEARRMQLKLEMPDRWSDILGPANVPGGAVGDYPPPAEPPAAKELPSGRLFDFPPLAKLYLRRYNAMKGDASLITQYQSAECLYMVIMFATGDGEARTLFRTQEIGDVDGDGAPEFLDGWGQPIGWMRSPTAYRSTLISGDPLVDHDAHDIYNIDPRAYRLVPLVFSAGPDGASGINTKGDSFVAPIDPYATPDMGAYTDDESWRDNVTNHLIE